VPTADQLKALGQRASAGGGVTSLGVDAIGKSLNDVLKERRIADEGGVQTYPADVVYFGKVFKKFGSLCDNGSATTLGLWGSELWKSGDRRMLVVTMVSEDADNLLQSKVLAEASVEDKTLPVYECRASFGDSKVKHYVIQAAEAIRPSKKPKVEKFLVEQAARLFELQ
jgi:hypothetical protein